MAVLKGITRSTRSEALSGRFMVDTVRGVLRVRAWPKKRGTPKSELQRWWIDWFRQANKLAKYADPMSQARAIEITKDSGMYPRDVLLSAMRGRLYYWQDQNGKVWHPMAAVQDISQSLDVLAQNVGNVLVRAVDRWRAAGPAVPVIGDALTYQGPDDPPIWASSGGGGAVQVLPGTPITCDNTVNVYVFDVGSYANVQFILDGVDFAASDLCQLRCSTDGGVSYKAGGTDYRRIFYTPTSQGSAFDSNCPFIRAGGATDHYGIGIFNNLRAGRMTFQSDISVGGSLAGRDCSIGQFNGPVTHIQMRSNGGNNFSGGVIRATGLLAA